MTQLTLEARAGGPAIFQMKLGLDKVNRPPLAERTMRLATAATLLLAVPAFYVLAWVIATQVLGWTGFHLEPRLFWGRLFEICTPFSVLVAFAAIGQVRIGRSGGAFGLRASMQLYPWLVVVGLFGLLFGGMFYAHLLFDGIACANGVASAC